MTRTRSRQPIVLCVLALPFLAGLYALILGYWARPAIAKNTLMVQG